MTGTRSSAIIGISRWDGHCRSCQGGGGSMTGTLERGAYYGLDSLNVWCGISCLATSTVRLQVPYARLVQAAATGSGPVDASFRAVEKIIGVPFELVDYEVRSLGPGSDAMAEVRLRIRLHKQEFEGLGTHTDSVVASVLA